MPPWLPRFLALPSRCQRSPQPACRPRLQEPGLAGWWAQSRASRHRQAVQQVPAVQRQQRHRPHPTRGNPAYQGATALRRLCPTAVGCRRRPARHCTQSKQRSHPKRRRRSRSRRPHPRSWPRHGNRMPSPLGSRIFTSYRTAMKKRSLHRRQLPPCSLLRRRVHLRCRTATTTRRTRLKLCLCRWRQEQRGPRALRPQVGPRPRRRCPRSRPLAVPTDAPTAKAGPAAASKVAVIPKKKSIVIIPPRPRAGMEDKEWAGTFSREATPQDAHGAAPSPAGVVSPPARPGAPGTGRLRPTGRSASRCKVAGWPKLGRMACRTTVWPAAVLERPAAGHAARCPSLPISGPCPACHAALQGPDAAAVAAAAVAAHAQAKAAAAAAPTSAAAAVPYVKPHAHNGYKLGGCGHMPPHAGYLAGQAYNPVSQSYQQQ